MKKFFNDLWKRTKSFFSTLKKSDKYIYIDKYTDILPVIDSLIDRFKETEIIIDFPISSMLHMNIPRYLYKKYGKDNFTKESASMGTKLTYIPKNIVFILTYSAEGRVETNVTIKIGNDLVDYIVSENTNHE